MSKKVRIVRQEMQYKNFLTALQGEKAYQTYQTHQIGQIPVRQKTLSFDLEWSLSKDEFDEYPIIAAGFCDNRGFQMALLLEDFSNERGLLSEIVRTIDRYDWSIGFYSTGIRAFNPAQHKITGRDSDLIQLHRRLLRYRMDSPIYISEHTGKPYLTNNNHVHLDAYNLFTNKVIKTSIYNNAYNSFDLDTISRAILGDKKGGKFEGISGPMFESLKNVDDKRAYVLRDAELLMLCVAHNDYELLNIMGSISELTGISFRDVCNSKGVTKIWTPILDRLVQTELSKIDDQGNLEEAMRYATLSDFFLRDKDKKLSSSDIIITEDVDVDNGNDDNGGNSNNEVKNSNSNNNNNKKEPRYIGGWTFDKIVPGEYKNVTVFDITSLYPTMIVNHNISFETVNCNCCVNEESARVPKSLFESIDSDNEKVTITQHHICIKHEGILAREISKFMNKRIDIAIVLCY